MIPILEYLNMLILSAGVDVQMVMRAFEVRINISIYEYKVKYF